MTHRSNTSDLWIVRGARSNLSPPRVQFLVHERNPRSHPRNSQRRNFSTRYTCHGSLSNSSSRIYIPRNGASVKRICIVNRKIEYDHVSYTYRRVSPPSDETKKRLAFSSCQAISLVIIYRITIANKDRRPRSYASRRNRI